MYHTFLSKQKEQRYIIQCDFRSVARETMNRLEPDSSSQFLYQLSAFDPTIECNQITVVIPTTIVHSNGKIEKEFY